MWTNPAEEYKKLYEELKEKLNNWEKNFEDRTPEEVINEISLSNDNKQKLEEWEKLFSNKKPEKVLEELKKIEAEKNKYLQERDARPDIKKETWEEVNKLLNELRISAEDKEEAKDYLSNYKSVLERSIKNFDDLKRANKSRENTYNIEQKNLEARVEQIDKFIQKVENWGKK